MSEPLPAAETRVLTPKKFEYEYPQASPCGALVMYTQNGKELDVITTFRAESVGAGRSVTAGGFWEVKDMLTVPDKLQDGDAELYREVYEELGEGIKTLIPYEEFCKRVEHLWDGMRHIGDGPNVHTIVQKMLRVSEHEKEEILVMQDTEEQKGKKVEHFVLGAYNDAASAEKDIRQRLSDFRYPIEVNAVVKWYDRLNNADKPKFQPPGGWN